MINGVIITQLDIIESSNGSVMHAMKDNACGFCGFGEAYFSEVSFNSVKEWRRHKSMTLNLIVPIGKIRFVLFDDRESSSVDFQEVVISRDNYCRLTIPPMVWFGFKGLSTEKSILLNIANIRHNTAEIDRRSINDVDFNW
jgi:dTDP-4-dehydrorhamnose 3,5-epimerase